MPSSSNPGLPDLSRAIGPVIVVLALIAIAFGAFVQIGPGQRGVLMTWGAVQQGVLDPGLHMKIPFMQSVAKMDVQIHNSQASETAASMDLQDVESEVAVNWHILPADAEWIYQHVGDERALGARVIKPAISNAVKAVTAHFNAEDLVVHRDDVRNQIESQIKSALTPYRVVVDSVNITNFQFSPQYAQAIEEKQVAQQKALQATYDLQKAKVRALQRIVEATAQSKAQALLRQTLTPEIIQQEAIQKWNGVLPTVTSAGGVLPMIGNVSVAGAH